MDALFSCFVVKTEQKKTLIEKNKDWIKKIQAFNINLLMVITSKINILFLLYFNKNFIKTLGRKFLYLLIYFSNFFKTNFLLKFEK